MSDAYMVLFSYGTLRYPTVQQDTFGRLLETTADSLPGYRKTEIEITDPDVLASSNQRFHPIICQSKDKHDYVEGVRVLLTREELAAADRYEVDDYARVEVILSSGIRAFAYVDAREVIPQS